MIARLWHGRTPTSKAEAYCELLKSRAIPAYQSVAGNQSVYILERRDGDITHFITLSFWRDLGAIKGFAGESVETAQYFREDHEYLLEFEPNIVRYEVVASVS